MKYTITIDNLEHDPCDPKDGSPIFNVFYFSYTLNEENMKMPVTFGSLSMSDINDIGTYDYDHCNEYDYKHIPSLKLVIDTILNIMNTNKNANTILYILSHPIIVECEDVKQWKMKD